MSGNSLFNALCTVAVFISASHASHAYDEAPQLTARVAAGLLPPLAQRLPDRPEVIKPAQTGHFGGTLRSALLADGDQNGVLRFIAQGLTRWDKKFDHIEPNITESWTRNAEATEYVFTLRRGMRWSDGEPFTADDIVFAVNDVLGNREIFKAVPDRYQAAGQVMHAERIDETHVRIRFAAGNRNLAEELAGPYGHHPVTYPKHYCAQFHIKYNAQAAEQAQQAGIASWSGLFNRQCGDFLTRWSNPAKPTLDPWVIVEPYAASADKNTKQVLLQRNAYFWQLDSAGQQLPYIDTLQFGLYPDPVAVRDAAAAGKFDLQLRHVSTVQARKQLEPLVQTGSYASLSLPDVNASNMGLYLNHSTANLPLRVLFSSVRFKAALSLAIDRKEISNKAFFGEVQPWQVGPPAGHRLYNQKLATQYLTFDLAGANRILDELGLVRRDAEGFRLLNGTRLSMRAIVNNNNDPMTTSLELIRQSWGKAGIALQVEALDRSVNMQRAFTNDYDISVDVVSGGLDPTQNPRAYLTVHPSDSRQSLPWVRWYDSHGALGDEPSPSMQKRLQLWDQWKAAKTDAVADRLFREILAIAADELEVIGTVSAPMQSGIRSSKLINVPDDMPSAWIWPTPGPSMPQQYFFAH
jgi:peptide/nickel transport system substrate-binding protein